MYVETEQLKIQSIKILSDVEMILKSYQQSGLDKNQEYQQLLVEKEERLEAHTPLRRSLRNCLDLALQYNGPIGATISAELKLIADELQ